ncbi:beta-lactamase/transpeptidase-like protein [Phaeosphaeriaceae sp. PMI808]|nr:beta-lactamase/transpeptidase-like protein [Phaeosphaeriaceae sp. PMI808]
MQTLRQNRMPTADHLFDKELLVKVTSLLQAGSVHQASISFQSLTSTEGPTLDTITEIITLERTQQGQDVGYTRSSSEKLFHIASITKMLVAAALIHAIEVKAEDPINGAPWAKFKGILYKPLTDVYNEHIKNPQQKMGDLHGDPTIHDYILHSKGFDSFTHLLLAFTGEPLLTLEHLREDLIPPFQDGAEAKEQVERWTKYSNINYSVLALAIGILWDGDLSDFMEQTLFEPLGMRSTSIGFSNNPIKGSSRWTVDQNGTIREVQIPECEASGAEAAALGGYSTAQDLNIFLSSMVRARQGEDSMKDFMQTSRTLFSTKNMQLENELHYTPFGLRTSLASSEIGSLSVNGLQFPEELSTTYPVMPGKIGEEYRLYYMAGSAVGCCCATALRLSETDNFALVVLTNTSGPVDVADHILRLILREYVQLHHPRPIPLLHARRSVGNMATRGKGLAIDDWKAKEKEDQRLKDRNLQVPLNLDGVFKGIGFHQQLHIVTRNGRHFLTISGSFTPSISLTPAAQNSFELVWKDQRTLKLCIPPYISIDCLGNGDWSNLDFEVTHEGNRVVELKRKNGLKTAFTNYRRLI